MRPSPEQDRAGAPTREPGIVVHRGEDVEGAPFRIGDATVDWHQHDQGQLTVIASGHLHVRTDWGSWMLPPGRALWVPPGVRHWGRMSGVRSGCNLLVDAGRATDLPAEPRVVRVGAVLRALIDRVCSWTGEPTCPARERLVAVLVDEIGSAPVEPLHLPMPTDQRLLRMVGPMLAGAAFSGTLDVLAREAAVSARTARRRFVEETGLSFAAWREQARLVAAVERLTAGAAVADVADALGYSTTSAFIAMFRRALGTTPGRYVT